MSFFRTSLPVLLAAVRLAHSAESLHLIVSNETAPAGGTVQIKVRAAEPRRIRNGYILMKFDRSYFADIRNVVSLSATGDAMGWANTSDSSPMTARLMSATGAIGQLADLPVLTITATLRPGIPEGTEIPVRVEAVSNLWWGEAEGSAYELTSRDGSVRIGGSLSVTDVYPGGGVLPAGSVVSITGTGFDPATVVSIDGAALEKTTVIGSDRIDVVLAGAVEITGLRMFVENGSGEHVDFFPALPTRPRGSTGTTHLFGPLVTHTSGRGGGSTVSATHVLVNPGPDPVEVRWKGVEFLQPVYGQSTVEPGEQLRVSSNGRNPISFVANGPLRAFVYNIFYRLIFPPWVSAPDPEPSLPPVSLRASGSLEWVALQGRGELDPVLLSVTDGKGRARLSKPASATWLTFETDEVDVPSTVRPRANATGLAPGVYAADITITPIQPDGFSDIPVKTETLRATLTIYREFPAASLPSLSVNEKDIARLAIAGGEIRPTQLLYNPSPTLQPEARIEYFDGSGWLKTAPNPETKGQLDLHFETRELRPGHYRASVTVSAAGFAPSKISVTLLLSSQAPLRVTPSELRFVVPAGETSAPLTVEAGVADGVDFVASESNGLEFVGSPPLAFLYRPTPALGKATMSRNTPGEFSGVFGITGINSRIEVPWTAVVTASEWSPPTLAFVVAKGTQKRGALLPDEEFTAFGSGIGGAGSTEVLINGEPARILASTLHRIDFVVPGSLATGTVARLEIIADGRSAAAWEVPVAGK